LSGEESFHDSLSDDIKRNDNSRREDQNHPLVEFQTDGTKPFSSDERETNLNNKNNGDDDNETFVVKEMVEEIDAGDSDVEGVEISQKDEKGEEGGQKRQARFVDSDRIVHVAAAGEEKQNRIPGQENNASLETSAPLPIAKPTSAFLRAEESLTPSPVIPTTFSTD